MFQEVTIHDVHVDAVKGAALMRNDMGKCVIERPRSGSSAASRKARSFGKIILTEEGPEYFGETKLPMNMNGRAHGWDSKSFTDVLGPLENYLRSSCGRHWNDIYSEIRKTLGHSGWAVEHIIRDHINVAVNTWRSISGKVWNDGKDGPETVGGYRYQFYVEPETGILRETPHGRSWHASRRPKEQAFADSIPLTFHTEYRLIAGIWYFQDYRETEVRVFVRNSEYSGRPIYEYQTLKDIVEKRQLSKKELRRLGLKTGQKVRTE